MKMKFHRIASEMIFCAALIKCVSSSMGAEVPYQLHHIIEAGAGGRQIVFTRSLDMDLDGDFDVLVVTRSGDREIAWWENRSADLDNWSKHLVVRMETTSSILVEVGDLDGDGDLDVAAARTEYWDVLWWENLDGMGRLWSEETVEEYLPDPESIGVADLDGDKDLDIVCGSGWVEHVLQWYENSSGNGSTWAEHNIENMLPKNIDHKLCDMDGDGDTDIVGSASSITENDGIYWWDNTNGRGTSWERKTVLEPYEHVARVMPVDMDHDGDVDIVASATGAGIPPHEICWIENLNRSGTSWKKRLISDNDIAALDMRPIDLDRDGDVDIAVMGSSGVSPSRCFYWIEYIQERDFWALRGTDSGTYYGNRIDIEDYDQDGDLDVLSGSSHSTAPYISWWENRSVHRNGSFPIKKTIAGKFNGADCVRAADLNGDGTIDVVGTAWSDNDIIAWLSLNGDGKSWWRVPIETYFAGVESIELADLDGDLDLDIIGAGSGADALRWWVNDGNILPEFTERSIASGFNGAQDVCIADLDGDGDLDVAGAAYFDNRVAWWENDGSPANGGWVEHDVSVSLAGAYSVAAADVNGDGFIDLIAAGSVDGRILWFQNMTIAGTRVFWPRVVDDTFPGARAVAAGDIDGDGDTDIAGAGFSDDTVALWFNNGAAPPAWTRRNLYTGLDGAIDVLVQDLDMDQDLDVAAIGLLAGELHWWDNKYGNGSGWNHYVSKTTIPALRSLCAADLDRDADPDLITAADGDSDEIAWWPNVGGQYRLTAATYGIDHVGNTQTVLLFIFIFQHNGRNTDQAAVLESVRFLFEESPGTPLSSEQLEGLVDEIKVYRDDGDGFFDSGDLLAGTFHHLNSLAGRVTLPFETGSQSVHIAPARSGMFFVTLKTASSATQAGIAQLRITHLPEESSASDDEYGMPLSIEYGMPLSTSIIGIKGTLPPLEIQTIERTGPGSIRIEWNSLGPGVTYTVYVCSGSLFSAPWIQAPGTWPSPATSWTDNAVSTNGIRFYRVRANPAAD